MLKMSITILAIETSCDDTAISILRAKNGVFEVLTNEVSSQTELHAQWGGVVPNLAAREHQKNIFPMLSLALEKAGVLPSEIDLFAMTQGPGLIPALLVGTSAAKTLSYLWGKPLIGIHHVEGHIYANFIGEISNNKFQITNEGAKIENQRLKISFPVLALVVSGGHTQLVLMRDHLQYEIVGQTLDDAAGEAFDKVARILDIGYPGGPAVAQRAENFKLKIKNSKSISNDTISDDKNIPDIGYNIKFPRPMLNKNNFDFSFSGLKTAVLYETKKFLGGSTSQMEVKPPKAFPEDYISEVCHEFQQAVVDVLVKKTIKAALEYKPKTIMLAGGVSANKELREQLGEAIKNLSDMSYLVPDLALTGDNATMIAAAAAFRWQNMSDAGKEAAENNWKTLVPDTNLKLQ